MRMGTSRRWFIESGVCPYGHPISVCMRKKRDERRGEGRFVYVCNIQRRERENARYGRNRPLVMKQDLEMASTGGRPFKTDKQLMQRVGTLPPSGDSVCYVQLVCHCILAFSREFMWSSERTSYDLWCNNHKELKRVHQASASRSDMLAMVYYPLEEKEITVWKHHKIAGSGRA